MYCTDIIQTSFFIFSNEVPHLLYYSHLPAFIISIALGLWVFFSAKKSLESKIFLVMSLIFAALSFCNLIIWTNSNSWNVSFFWILTIELFNWLLFFISYFFYVFLTHKDVRSVVKIIILSLLLLSPIYILSKFGISEFDLDSCELIINNNYYLYQLAINILAVGTIIYTFLKYKKTIEPGEKKKNILFFLASMIFSVFFLATWHLSTYFDTFVYEQIGYIGFIVFIALVSYLIVKFKVFHIKLLATQALIWGLIVLIGSQFFFIQSNTNMILNGITFVGIIIFGSNLIKSVKREVEQREILEHITIELSDANEKLKGLDKLKTEFVSLASHQLRSPLTAIKGYASMLSEGDYGDVPTEAKNAISRIFMSCQNLTKVVEDLLDVTKIEQGGMKYVMSPFNLTEVAMDMVKDLSIAAKNKGLELNYVSDPNISYSVNGDKEKIRQVILNLIDNSIKYTTVGKIDVLIAEERGKTIFSVSDTGVGMSEQIKESLFQKFSRGDGAKINTSGSGLGLYLAKEIVEAHKGRVWVESEGLNKGSTFKMELDSLK